MENVCILTEKSFTRLLHDFNFKFLIFHHGFKKMKDTESGAALFLKSFQNRQVASAASVIWTNYYEKGPVNKDSRSLWENPK
jgi:hypothetical protein